MKPLSIISHIRKHNREVWGFSLFIPLFLSVFALFVILAASIGDINLFHIIFFVIASSVFWLIDPWLKTVIPRNVANLLMISIYLLLSQFLIAYTGGVHSQFFFVYYIVIFTGAINYGLSGSLFVTMLLFFVYLSFASSKADLYLITNRWIILFILSLMIGFLSEHKKRIESVIFQRMSKMATLNEISKLLKATLKKDKILSLILDISMSILNGQYGGIYIYDKDTNEYKIFTERNPKKYKLYDLFQEEGNISVIDWIESVRRPILIKRFNKNQRFHDHINAKKIIKSLLAISFNIDSDTKIILVLANKGINDFFNDDDYELFNIIINEIEITLENARLHQQVIEMKNYRDLLMSSISYCIVAIDSTEKIITLNPAVANLLEYHEKQILGENFYKIFRVNKNDIFVNNTESIVLSKEVVISNSKGEKIPVEMSVNYLQGNREIEKGYIFIFRDIRREKSIEEELEKKKTLATLGEMAATVAHEIRNPLGGIEGFASLLERDLADKPDKAVLAKKIADGAHSLNNIVKQLLIFTGDSKPVKMSVGLNSLIDNSLTFVEDNLNYKKIKLKKNYKVDEEFKINLDTEKIKQVLQNLVINASDVLEQSGTITILTNHNKTNNKVYIAVKDNGPGISNETLEKIWDPFFTTKAKGLGLGLSISRKIIEEHGGKLWAENINPTGTAFWIELPV